MNTRLLTLEDKSELEQQIEKAGSLCVTVTRDPETMIATADKTAEEILAAYNSGKSVFCKDDGYVLPLSNVEGKTIKFANLDLADGYSKALEFEILDSGEIEIYDTATKVGGGDIVVDPDEPGSGTGGATPDFNAAPGEQGHILNRTHYDEWETVIPETVAEDMDGMIMVDATDLAETLKIGETYRVTINGVSYESVAQVVDTEIEEGVTVPVTFIGDFPGMMGGVSTGEPYAAINGIGQPGTMQIVVMGEFTEMPTISLHHFGVVPIPIRYMPEPCVVSLNYEDFTTEYGSVQTGGASKSFVWASLEDREYDVSGLARAWVEKRPIIIEIYSEHDGVRTVLSRLTPTSFNPLALLVDPSQYLDDPDVLNAKTWWDITAMGVLVNGTSANWIEIELGYVDF